MIRTQTEELAASAQRDSRNCHFCNAEWNPDIFWHIGNTFNTKSIWICIDCMTKENVEKWMEEL